MFLQGRLQSQLRSTAPVHMSASNGGMTGDGDKLMMETYMSLQNARKRLALL